MTKKHYEIVASSIQNQINKVVENDELDFDSKYLQLRILHDIQTAMAYEFKLDNNNFSFAIWNSKIQNPYLYYRKQSAIYQN